MGAATMCGHHLPAAMPAADFDMMGAQRQPRG
jgi:hypothetical protein